MNLRISRGAMRTPLLAVSCALGLWINGSGAWAQTYVSGLDAVDAGRMEEAVDIWETIIRNDAPDRAQAEYALALLYETGRAVPWDEAKAAALYASSGLPEALTNLGLMYAEGRGVDFDPAKAAELWQEASDQGHSFASFNLGLAYYAGDGVPRNAVRALELIYDAGDGGLAEAQWAVCQFYERGVGVDVDLVVALDWCERAAEQGHPQATEAAARLKGGEPTVVVPTLEPLPEDNPDDVDLAAQTPVVDEAVEADPALEFATEEPADPVAEAPAADDPQPVEPPEDAVPADPLLLLGSEFEEFADLLAPIENDAGATGETGLDALSADSDEIAALIDSAGTVEPQLPDLDIAEQPDAADLLRAEADDRGAPLSLQELVDGELAAVTPSAANGEATPPLPIGRPELTYAIPPIVDEDVFAVWLGTGEDADEARAIYDDVMDVAPEILGIMEAAYQNDSLPPSQTGLESDLPVVRLLFGPLPGEDYAWQICNLLKIKQKTMFCYPVEVEG